MRSWWSFNRSILFFSALMVLLLLWLSLSFLMQAFSARQEAQFLARYLHIDAVIRATVTTVAQERAASHWLTGLEGIFSAENSLSIPHSRSDTSFQVLFDELQQTVSDKRFSSQLTYQPAYILAEVADLRKSKQDLALRREAIISDLNLPLDDRNTRLQLSAFDFYGRMIDKLEQLRYAFQFRPTQLSREVDTGLMISNAAWNLNLSHHLLSPLFESYILSLIHI